MKTKPIAAAAAFTLSLTAFAAGDPFEGTGTLFDFSRPSSPSGGGGADPAPEPPAGKVEKSESKSESESKSKSESKSGVTDIKKIESLMKSAKSSSTSMTTIRGKTVSITRRILDDGAEEVIVTTFSRRGKPKVEKMTADEFELKYGDKKAAKKRIEEAKQKEEDLKKGETDSPATGGATE